jgi:hypothetical protein
VLTLHTIQVSETGAPTEPVSRDEVKSWAKIDHTDDDTLIDSMRIGARQDIEQELNVKLVPSTVSFYLTTTLEGEQLTMLPWAFSLAQVSALTVNLIEDGETNQLQVLNEDYYFNGSLKIAADSRNLIAYTVTPVVPTAIKEAIKMLVAYRYNNRGDHEKQAGIPEDIERKIAKWRQIWL